MTTMSTAVTEPSGSAPLINAGRSASGPYVADSSDATQKISRSGASGLYSARGRVTGRAPQRSCRHCTPLFLLRTERVIHPRFSRSPRSRLPRRSARDGNGRSLPPSPRRPHLYSEIHTSCGSEALHLRRPRPRASPLPPRPGSGSGSRGFTAARPVHDQQRLAIVEQGRATRGMQSLRRRVGRRS
jgi:hypothetical protein